MVGAYKTGSGSNMLKSYIIIVPKYYIRTRTNTPTLLFQSV